METLRPILPLVVLTALLLELFWSRSRGRRIYSWGESLTNFGILLGNRLLEPLSLAWSYLVFQQVERFRIFELPRTAGVALLTFLAVELFYYWYHRLSHEVPLLWTVHHTHHSSPFMNFTTAIRLSWLGKFVSPLFFLPLVCLGFPPAFVVGSLALGLFYQFFLHTEAIRTLGPLEGWLNTPSAHRVHHGSNAAYIDKNYGAVLLLWDRLFGTYQSEVEPVRYGVTTGAVGHNPFRVVLGPLWLYLRGGFRREREVLYENEGSS
jgi:sterol desaturase/sphingolipid hydroxylase (fatty acid hydroxylase superfamily)